MSKNFPNLYLYTNRARPIIILVQGTSRGKTWACHCHQGHNRIPKPKFEERLPHIRLPAPPRSIKCTVPRSRSLIKNLKKAKETTHTSKSARNTGRRRGGDTTSSRGARFEQQRSKETHHRGAPFPPEVGRRRGRGGCTACTGGRRRAKRRRREVGCWGFRARAAVAF